jgi:hypothetical protein
MSITKYYASVGSCIYCGAQEWSEGKSRKLGDEHIVPEGLGGKLLLPEASCKACEEKTSQFELEWLRGSFHSARVQKGLGKKRKRSPRFIPLKIQKNGRTVWKQIPIEKYPALIVTLVFDTPDILTGCEPIEKELSGGVAVGTMPTFGLHLQEYLNQGTVSFEPPRNTANSQHLGRMLAKIAHSYTVAELGLNGFKPFLQKIILGSDIRHLGHYIGGTREIPPKINDVYEVRLTTVQSSDRRNYLMVIIRLLADVQGMPEYRVIVGEAH